MTTTTTTNTVSQSSTHPPNASSSSSSSSKVVEILEWDHVASDETTPQLLSVLERSLGPNGIGLVAIRNVPDLCAAKQACLPLAHPLAHLPADYLEEELTDPASLYNAGWSYGKEKLGDEPDLAKGSFYYNPITDTPGSAEDRQQYPLSYPNNKWPDESKLPHFRHEAIRLGRILTTVVTELSKHVDALAHHKVPHYPHRFLYQALQGTQKSKARLLYYFPLQQQQQQGEDGEPSQAMSVSEDSWIGWHNDSGFLTALAGDLYVNDETGETISNPDPDAGLYVLDRNQECQHIALPFDCVAVQIGECTQIVTGGVVAATPHCVRAGRPLSSSSRIARISLPCFVDTPPNFPLSVPPGSSRDQVLQAARTSRQVPPLADRWTENGMTFGAFLEQSFSVYYDWNK